MDFVKREDAAIIDEAAYKAYMENLQKTHQEQMEYQHTPISMEQLHQVMQNSLNTNINFALPISPRQMSTLMLKTNHLTRFAEIPAHLPRNLELELPHLDLPQNLCHDDLLTQNINRSLDISLARSLSNEIDLQNSLQNGLVQNLSEDLRMDVTHNLRNDILSHELDLSHHLNRNLEQELLPEERRTPMVIQCVPDTHIDLHQQRLEQNLRLEQPGQRLEQPGQRLEQPGQRLEQTGQRLEQTGLRLEQPSQRLEPTLQPQTRIDQNMAHRLHQTVVQRLDQIGHRDLMHSLEQVSQRLEQVGHRLGTINERQISQDHVLPMQFHIKSEQEDESYFYDNINHQIPVDAISGHLQAESTQSQPTLQNDTQIYPIYTPHTIPALNPIDLYRNQNYPQNYTRDNPQNLVIHRQYDEELKKRQDDIKKNEPKENQKPTDNKEKEENKLSEELSMNIKGEYICFKCNEIFPSKRGLKQHAKSCVDDENSEKSGKFACTQCPYRCQSPAILKIHERTHSGEKPFSCNFCDYKSGQKNNVAKHILVHMKEKPFRCQYCDYRCAQKNNLVVHERTHTGYKPFACPYCDYRTVQKPNLVKHMYLHTDQKPFSCDLCSYRCVQKTNLTKHKQRHLNDKDVKLVVKDQKPYRPRQKSVKCVYCAYRCVQKSSMDKHVQFKHPGMEMNGEFGQDVMENDDVQNLSVKDVLQDSVEVQA